MWQAATWFVGPLEAFITFLPRVIARPICAAIAFLYFQWKLLLTLMLPTVLVGVPGPPLAYDLPPQESILALLLIVGLLVIAYVQWGQVQRLRAASA